ncbi:MAG: FAD:protein FMN transferase [Candidatus Omnitrophota bacterium]
MKRSVVLLISFTLLCGCQRRPLYKETRVLMGTFVQVTSPEKEAPEIVFAEIRRIEALLNRYKEDSEISRLNKIGRLRVSHETFLVVKKAKEFWAISEGAFDITVAPLVDIWGFNRKDFHIPEPGLIKKNLALVGSDKIILHEEEDMVEFKTPGTRIDLGAIGKGFAIDSAVRKLKEHNIHSCLINAGGQVYALGTKYGLPWRIGVISPRKNGVRDLLKLTGKSVSTSGDYEQYFVKEGKRYSHIFNPKTGYPADSGVISVTVIADDGLTADALSTAIFVLGKAKGEQLLREFPGVEARIIEEEYAPHN